ncbi:MAG: GNAT family N-acetyltransferase [Oligoflexales bacterium]
MQLEDPGPLTDGEFWLELKEMKPGIPEKGWVPAFFFRLRLKGVEESVGRIDLRIGNPERMIMFGGHIGYGVEPQFRGKGYAARACRLLFPLAKKYGINPIWITCAPDNKASSRTCENAGGKYVETVDLPLDHEMRTDNPGRTQSMRYRFDL